MATSRHSALCQRFYADEIRRPGLAPGRYYRLLLIGYFEGLDAERVLVAGDRERSTALAATRDEREELLKTAQPPANALEHQELKTKVAEIVAGRREDFARFQVMKKAPGFKEGAVDDGRAVEGCIIERGWTQSLILRLLTTTNSSAVSSWLPR
jgi:hypothetical protein